MFAAMAPDSFSNSVWIAHPTTLPQLMATTIVVGSGGSFVPLQGAPDNPTRLTRPVIFSEKLNTLGALGDLLFCDLSMYVCGLRSDATLDKSMHSGFSSDSSHYRILARLDAQPKLAAPITMPSGDKVSPFVTLAAR